MELPISLITNIIAGTYSRLTLAVASVPIRIYTVVHAIMEEEELEVRSVTPTESNDKPSPARGGTKRSSGKKSKVWSPEIS